MLHEEPQLAVLPSDLESLDMLNQHELSFPLPTSGNGNNENLALVPVDSESKFVSEELGNLSHLEKKVLPLENPREMMARWKLGNLDLKTVVKDALLSGRLPLAVLQLHLHQSEDFIVDKGPHDTFTEVRDIGRAVAYDLFMKVLYSTFYLDVTHLKENNMTDNVIIQGETEIAVATLQRLGENIEYCLKQLLFGTVRRSLRAQIAEEMKRHGYLGPYELKILKDISLIEVRGICLFCFVLWSMFST